MQEVLFTFTGTSPLLVNNPQTVNPLNEYSKATREITDKRKKTDEDHLALMRLKWEASLYHDPKRGPYLPSQCAWKTLHSAAKISKAGKQIERGVTIVETLLPIEYDGPRDLEGMWQAKRFVDIRDANAMGRRITASRAIFPQWRISFTAAVLDEIINVRDLIAYAQLAGRVEGIGTYRRQFGRFTVEAVEGGSQRLAAE